MRELGMWEEQQKDLSSWSSMTERKVNGRKQREPRAGHYGALLIMLGTIDF